MKNLLKFLTLFLSFSLMASDRKHPEPSASPFGNQTHEEFQANYPSSSSLSSSSSVENQSKKDLVKYLVKKAIPANTNSQYSFKEETIFDEYALPREIQAIIADYLEENNPGFLTLNNLFGVNNNNRYADIFFDLDFLKTISTLSETKGGQVYAEIDVLLEQVADKFYYRGVNMGNNMETDPEIIALKENKALALDLRNRFLKIKDSLEFINNNKYRNQSIIKFITTIFTRIKANYILMSDYNSLISDFLNMQKLLINNIRLDIDENNSIVFSNDKLTIYERIKNQNSIILKNINNNKEFNEEIINQNVAKFSLKNVIKYGYHFSKENTSSLLNYTQKQLENEQELNKLFNSLNGKRKFLNIKNTINNIMNSIAPAIAFAAIMILYFKIFPETPLDYIFGLSKFIFR